MDFKYLVSTRRIRDGAFDSEPGKTRFLKVPWRELPKPEHELRASIWAAEVRDLADGCKDSRVSPAGEILFFVHGYNNAPESIDRRQRWLQKDLREAGWCGLVVGFDWPSDDSTLNYLEDRSDAAKVADRLVNRALKLLVRGQADGCQANIHLLGHSTGAFVILEAFAAAEKNGEFYKSDWRIGQVAFIGGDVSSGSLARDSAWARPMFRRIMRLTNYQNGYDSVLGISNAKRLGVSPRSGRVGLPDDAHPRAVNVDCSSYFESLDPEQQERKEGTWCHSWHIGNPLWTLDLAMTMEGRIDRHYLPTREQRGGGLALVPGQRPAHEERWLELG